MAGGLLLRLGLAWPFLSRQEGLPLFTFLCRHRCVVFQAPPLLAVPTSGELFSKESRCLEASGQPVATAVGDSTCDSVGFTGTPHCECAPSGTQSAGREALETPSQHPRQHSHGRCFGGLWDAGSRGEPSPWGAWPGFEEARPSLAEPRGSVDVSGHSTYDCGWRRPLQRRRQRRASGGLLGVGGNALLWLLRAPFHF